MGGGGGPVYKLTGGKVKGPGSLLFRGGNKSGGNASPLEPPQPDTAMDILMQRALIERIRKQSIRGGGIQSTIATSAAGVEGITPTITKRLMGVK